MLLIFVNISAFSENKLPNHSISQELRQFIIIRMRFFTGHLCLTILLRNLGVDYLWQPEGWYMFFIMTYEAAG